MHVDGRRERRARNADVVVDAMLDLLAAGHVWPSTADVADRAGLSARSVHRYFDDLDALARAAVETQIQRADHLFGPIPAGGELDDRIRRLADHRVAMFDEVGPIVHAARVRAALHEPVAAGLALRRRQLRGQLRHLFAPEFAVEAAARTGQEGAVGHEEPVGHEGAVGHDGAVGHEGAEELLAALEVSTGFDALHALRVDRGLTAAGTRRVIRRTAGALLIDHLSTTEGGLRP